MAAAMRVATFPFRAVFRLAKFLILPVGVGALFWWLASMWPTWPLWAGVVFCAVWALLMANLWRIQMHGELRSLARGTVHIDGPRRRMRGGRR